jgi:hypothetical protein
VQDLLLLFLLLHLLLLLPETGDSRTRSKVTSSPAPGVILYERERERERDGEREGGREGGREGESEPLSLSLFSLS